MLINNKKIMETDLDVLEDVGTELLESLSNEKMVVLYNDDVNDFDSVIEALVEICEMDVDTACQKTFEAHVRGLSEVYRTDDEDKCKSVHHSLWKRGLTVEIVSHT